MGEKFNIYFDNTAPRPKYEPPTPKQTEERTLAYAKMQCESLNLSIEAGKRDKNNCQICGGVRFLPFIKKEETKKKGLNGNADSVRVVYYFYVRKCRCIGGKG